MSLIHLTAWDLALAAALVVALGVLSVPYSVMKQG